MEHIACNLCGADVARPLFEAKDRINSDGKNYSLVTCGRCGLVYLDPRPAEAEMASLYPPWYHQRVRDATVRLEDTVIWGVPWKKAMYYKTKGLVRHKQGGRILDIGCGDGSVLKYLRDTGQWETYGVELQTSAAEFASKSLGLNVFNGRLEDANLPAGTFDAVTMFHVFEHLSDPSRTLGAIRPLLKKDGVLLIEVPNFGSVEEALFGPYWMGISVPFHLYHFTLPTLRALLDKCGFSVRAHTTFPDFIRYVAGYSDSLRFVLADRGLYNIARHAGAAPTPGHGGTAGSMSNPFKALAKNIEYAVFSVLDRAGSAIGRGQNLLVAAQVNE